MRQLDGIIGPRKNTGTFYSKQWCGSGWIRFLSDSRIRIRYIKKRNRGSDPYQNEILVPRKNAQILLVGISKMREASN